MPNKGAVSPHGAAVKTKRPRATAQEVVFSFMQEEPVQALEMRVVTRAAAAKPEQQLLVLSR